MEALEVMALPTGELLGNATPNNVTDLRGGSTSASADDEDNERLEAVVKIVVPIFFGITILIGLVGNLLVVIVVAFNKQMRSTTNLLIINLAIADLLFIVFCIPPTGLDYMLTYWPFGNVMCQLVQYLIVVTAYASVYTLVLMSLDRYLAVVHPIASMSVRTESNAIYAVVILWLVIVLSCVPAFFSHGEMIFIGNHERNQSVCIFLDDYNKIAFQVSFFLTSYVIPLALIVGLYLFMLLRLWKNAAPGGRVSEEGRRGRKRVTRMVVVIVAIFAISWCPIQVILVLKSVHLFDITTLTVTLQICSHVLAYMNSCVNPILYAFLSENFRKAFRKVISFGPAQGTATLKNRMSMQNYGTDKPTTTKSSNVNSHIV